MVQEGKWYTTVNSRIDVTSCVLFLYTTRQEALSPVEVRWGEPLTANANMLALYNTLPLASSYSFPHQLHLPFFLRSVFLTVAAPAAQLTLVPSCF